jgi:photosynthetic reaction center cytochrome c subunit
MAGAMTKSPTPPVVVAFALSTLGLAVAGACGGSSPPPAQPEKQATAPATPPPATPTPPPAPEYKSIIAPEVPGPPADPAIVVKAMTAAGHDKPEGVELGERATKPASDNWKNVQLLGPVLGADFIAAMQSTEADLGKKCLFCHVKDHFDSDEKDEKVTARRMMKMVTLIDSQFFKGEVRVTCYTCHAGHETPAKLPDEAMVPPKNFPVKLSAADAQKPADKVFKNLKLLKALPAAQIPAIMSAVSASLGVKCDHCHVPNKWALDTKKPKQIARGMIMMVGQVKQTWFASEEHLVVGCFTCHKGNVKPKRTATE